MKKHAVSEYRTAKDSASQNPYGIKKRSMGSCSQVRKEM